MSAAPGGDRDEAPQTDRTTLHGGRVALDQPLRGYRAGLDAVVLAAALKLPAGSQACEFGCGAGAALLCAARLNPEVRFRAIEKDASMAALAAHNVQVNGLEARIRIETGDALELAGAQTCDAVFFNPPFFDDESALRPPSPERRAAWISEAPLADWISAGLKALRPRGELVLIHRADRLGTILTALEGRAGNVAVLPVHSREGDPAKRIVVRAVKASKAPLRVFSGLVVHGGDGRRFTDAASAIFTGDARLDLDPPVKGRRS